MEVGSRAAWQPFFAQWRISPAHGTAAAAQNTRQASRGTICGRCGRWVAHGSP